MIFFIALGIIIITIIITNIIKKKNDPTRKLINEILKGADEAIAEADELLGDEFKKDLSDEEIKLKITEMKKKIYNGTYFSEGGYVLDKIFSKVRLNNNEHICSLYYIDIIKEKTVKDGVKYGGFTGRVPIVKGLTYRVGDLNYTTETHKESYKADHGELFITNKALIFLGSNSSWRIQFDKIISIEVNQNNGHCLIKKGGGNISFEINHWDYRKMHYDFLPKIETLIDVSKK